MKKSEFADWKFQSIAANDGLKKKKNDLSSASSYSALMKYITYLLPVDTLLEFRFIMIDKSLFPCPHSLFMRTCALKKKHP